MKTWFLLFFALLVLLASAQDASPHPGDRYDVTSIDLNKDGRAEKVGLLCTERKESGWYSRLTVWDDKAQQIWQSMPAKVGVWSFGGWDWGISDLQLVADVDGDGDVEALVPEPVSDVSPVRFRVFRWSGKAFHHVRTAALLPVAQDRYAWSDRDQASSWIGAFQPGLVASIWTLGAQGESIVRKVRVKGERSGFRVLGRVK